MKADGSLDRRLLPRIGDIPDNVVSLSLENFERELRGLRNFTRLQQYKEAM